MISLCSIQGCNFLARWRPHVELYLSQFGHRPAMTWAPNKTNYCNDHLLLATVDSVMDPREQHVMIHSAMQDLEIDDPTGSEIRLAFQDEHTGCVVSVGTA